MPSTSAKRQHIHRIRKKELPVESNSGIDLMIPENLKITQTGERDFFLFDMKVDSDTLNERIEEDGDEEEDELQERIRAFGGDDNLRRLVDFDIWFLDGTFKTCLRLFYQLYSIHCRFEEQIFPVDYTLLTEKTTQIYSSMLEHLTSVLESKEIQLNPTFFVVDFELSSIKALQEKFSDARISGCFFHLCQSTYRSIQKNGLVDAYKNNENLALTLRQLAALAFLHSDEIDDAYLDLSNNIPNEV
ncbi:Hypothetical predicted protein [Octopus vulgaris]|uniref:MULE transposase domain-containing protein n=1 Tax=Octopus vulgaris TaxID=6645 RepID=A0AA36B9B1_OCTVU|nr:Hypothetical predicted protein [Octopus vulgaris]